MLRAVPRALPSLGPYSAERADVIEGELMQAQAALSALEEESARERLERVRTELLAHPELPQAAFLMAECLALLARAEAARDPALAQHYWRQRAALEGARASEFGAPEWPSEVPSEENAPSLRVSGLEAGDELELDGRPSPSEVRLESGLHHARVLRQGRPIFATFVEIEEGQRELALSVPAVPACAMEDLSAFSRRSAQYATPSRVRCPRWALVREQQRGIAVALCEHGRCGAFVSWQKRSAHDFSAPEPELRAGSWKQITLMGVATLAATALVLWQSGALDEGSRSTPVWRYGGLDPQLRF